jgi:hypothetical protein
MHSSVLAIFALSVFCLSSSGADQITLQLTKSATQAEIGLHSRMALPVSAMYPEYTILRSTDMVDWQMVAGPIAGSVGVSDEFRRVVVPTAGDHAFYRVMANVKLAADGGGGEAVYGYGTAFSQELQQLGQLSLADFVAIYGPTNEYLPQITFDPTTAEFWNLFSIDPAVWNATNSFQNRRLYDFRLNPQESAVFQTNAFVVSQRLQRDTFADVFYDIYTDDLPVFVTTDAILHAWHRSFVTMLEEIEETCFQATFSNLLVGMTAQVPTLWAQSAGTVMTNGVLDADYFLAVARSLVSGVNNYGSLGQTARVTTTLNAIGNVQPDLFFNLYGEDRPVDFSQFQVRGHYANSTTLTRYFRAMMWSALADFRYAGFSMGVDLGGNNTLRELSGAVALELALRNSGGFSNWLQFNRTLEMYVGPPDSLNFAQLRELLLTAGIISPADLPNQAALTNLQNQLMSGQLGMQHITSGYYFSPLGPGQVKLPRSFTVMGQRFVMDSWALGKCTFDSIFWDDDGIPTVWDKVQRRVPSALDIAFSVLGNSQIVPELAVRISRTNLTFADGRPYWRDGRKYQHNLAAVRNVIDSQTPAAWTNSIYNYWLACLRELSEPTTDSEYPEAMRTRAWAMKTLNTQLASWTELRHNTVLYAQQSYTPIVLCSYPDGYVEPRPAFWSRIGEMALATKAVLATLPASGVFTYTHYTNYLGFPVPFEVTVSGATMHSNRLAVMDQFMATTETLRAISEKELSKTALSAAETLFLQRLVEFDYVGKRTYTGWYPALFYESGKEYLPPNYQSGNQPTGDNKGSDYWDALVTDVHTDPSDDFSGDPGSILHEGVGNVQLLMVAVDCGPGDTAVYAGPVLSHYEFELGPTTRKTDAQWKSEVSAGNLPPQPDWTRGYLVPKP